MNITAETIIEKYNEIYPAVEGALSTSNALYTQGLADIERLYDEWDITGNDKAKFVTTYITNATAAMINGAMQVSLGLIERAYAMPADIDYKTAQTKVLQNSEILNALIKVFQSISDMMGSMGSGGIVASPSHIGANKEAVFKVLTVLKNPYDSLVFSQEEIYAILTLKSGDSGDMRNDKTATGTYNINKA